MLEPLMETKIGKWRCTVYRLPDDYKFAVCRWLGKGYPRGKKTKGVVVPSIVFETCNPEKYVELTLPEKVANALSEVCLLLFAEEMTK